MLKTIKKKLFTDFSFDLLMQLRHCSYVSIQKSGKICKVQHFDQKSLPIFQMYDIIEQLYLIKIKVSLKRCRKWLFMVKPRWQVL